MLNNSNIKKYIPILTILCVVISLLFISSGTAHAQAAGAIAGMVETAFNPVSIFMGWLVQTSGKIMVLALQLLDWVLNTDVGLNAAIIDSQWNLMRNFSNMFFIVILIVMAFATIFDVGSFGLAGYNIRSLIARFLIAALLINFSLVIGKELIYAVNRVNGVFLSAMGKAPDIILTQLTPGKLLGVMSPAKESSSSIAEKFDIVGCFMAPTICVGYATGEFIHAIFTGENPVKTAIAETIQAQFVVAGGQLMTVVMFGMVTVPVLVAFIVAAIRIPVLWFLLIFSPLAWLTMVLPITRGVHRAWWKQFWAWNLFIPFFLFFLYLGLTMLTKQGELFSELMKGYAANPKIAQAGDNMVQIIFFYLFTAFIFLGGTGIALKSSFVAGSGVVGATTWAKGAMSGALRKTGIPGAVAAKRKDIKEEGIRGTPFGGARALRGREAWLGAKLGVGGASLKVRGAELEKQKQFTGVASKEFGLMEQQYNLGQMEEPQLRAIIETGQATNPKVFAAYKLLMKKGKISGNGREFHKAMGELGKSRNSLAIEDLVKTAGPNSFANMGSSEILKIFTGKDKGYEQYKGAQYIPVLRQIVATMQKDKKLAGELDKEQLGRAVSIAESHDKKGGKELLDSVARVSPHTAIDYKLDHGLVDMTEEQKKIMAREDPNNTDAEKQTLKKVLGAQEMQKMVSMASAKDTVETSDTLWGDAEDKAITQELRDARASFQSAIAAKAGNQNINRRTRKKYLADLQAETLKAKNSEERLKTVTTIMKSLNIDIDDLPEGAAEKGEPKKAKKEEPEPPKETPEK